MKESVKAFYGSAVNFVKTRKILSGLILVILIYIIYKLFFSGTATTVTIYNIDTASKQTVVSYLSESGQVSVNGSVDIKSQVSGQITSVKVKSGDSVKAGQLIATVNSDTAYTTLQQAKLSYESAKVSYAKATSPAATTSVLTAQNNLNNSNSSLLKAYDDGFNNISKAYSDSSSIISPLHDSLYLSDLSSNQYDVYYYSDNTHSVESSYTLPVKGISYANDAIAKYNSIKNDYDIAFSNYQSLSHSSNSDEIYKSIQKTIVVSTELSDALKSIINLIQYYQDLFNKYNITVNSKTNTYLNNLNTYKNTIDTDLSTLSSAKNNIDSLNATILQQQSNLSDLQNGVSGLDLQSAQIAYQQAQLNYQVALNNYNNYFITSPIDGVVSSVSGTVGQDASGVTIANIITKGKFANLSVSENDISKIKLGQKATLTFDAIDSLSLVGTVSEINQSGTVSSGVVSYNVKITFDDPNDQVKSQMSVTANIMTDIASDVISVPSSAVKSSTSQTYVETFDSTSSLITNGSGYTSSILPTKKLVTTGIVGDQYTEITSGINEGDAVVTKTNSAGVAVLKTTSSSVSSSRGGGFVGASGIPGLGR
ncbi:MAG: HlyD family efflux transporter periplasmic adaptor subunit [Candidatus Nomurabacteria bacterium]